VNGTEEEPRAGIIRRVRVRALGYCIAARPFGEGSDICTEQEHLGHRDVKTTMIKTHVLNRGPAGVRIPGDFM
jgi:site-specific recombinase XerD